MYKYEGYQLQYKGQSIIFIFLGFFPNSPEDDGVAGGEEQEGNKVHQHQVQPVDVDLGIRDDCKLKMESIKDSK